MFTRRQLFETAAMTATAAAFANREASAQTTLGAANDKVRAVLETIVRDTTEIGLQVAAYLDGKLVIDAWAGMADEANKKAVDGDTMFMLSSTTKGITATCMHLMVEKHKVSYDMPIVKCGPSSARTGKRTPRCVTRCRTRPACRRLRSATRRTGCPTGIACVAASPH